MADDQPAPTGPDLAPGVALADLPDGGKLLGHLGDEQVLLLRRGAEVFAIGASCTHYSGPLAEGLMVGDTIRCPWHHACFDLQHRRGAARPGSEPAVLLVGRTERRQDLRAGKTRAQGRKGVSARRPARRRRKS